MLPAPSLADVLQRAERAARNRDEYHDRLVSILFAPPSYLVVGDVPGGTRALQSLDDLTGEEWDLFFAGYCAWPLPALKPSLIEIDSASTSHDAWWFDPKAFADLVGDIEQQIPAPPEGWRFRGPAELVSFMVYAGNPDWETLTACSLSLSASGVLPEIHDAAHDLRGWQNEELRSRFAPGESPLGPVLSREALRAALRWTATAAAVGMSGAVTDRLLDTLLG